MKITPSQIYQAFVQLVAHSESISWNRFNNFLIVNSVLVLAWATVFVSDRASSVPGKIVMIFICVFGVLTGISWAGLGRRGRWYVNEYKKRVERIEAETDQAEWWENGIPADLRPFQVDKGKGSYDTSSFLVGVGPYVFSAMYVVLFVVSLP